MGNQNDSAVSEMTPARIDCHPLDPRQSTFYVHYIKHVLLGAQQTASVELALE